MSINQTNANKYLDSAGVSQLWTAIKNADSAVASSKVGYITVEGNTMYLWTDKLAYDNAIATGSNLATAAISTTDVSAFLTDGLLDSVTIVEASATNVIDGSTSGTYIEFKWKDANGDGTADKVSYLEASKIGKIYSEGTGINISDTDNKISVEDAPATEILTTEFIPTAGGPLATQAAKVYPDGIPVGTNIQSLLFSLFCQEEWPKSTQHSGGSVSVSMGDPTMSTTAPSGTYEIGTVLSLGDVTISSAATASITAYPKVSGFTYGYADKDDNTKDSSNTSISATVKTAAGVDSSNYSIAADYTNFLQTDGKTAMADIAASEHTASTYNDENIKIPATNVIVASGTNKVVYNAKGPKATVTFNSIPAYYAVSNIGKTHDDKGNVYHKSTELAESNPTSGQATSKLEVTVTGKYKYFIGYYSDSTFANKTYTSESIRTTNKAKSDWMNGKTISYTCNVPAGSKGMYIAIPAGIDDTGASLKVKQVNTNAYVNAEMVTNKRTMDLTCGGTHTKSYVIFTWSFPAGTDATEPFEITSF